VSDRGPVEQSTLVRSGVEHTFDVFVREIGQWWPTQPFSLGADRVIGVVFEEAEGGRVYEVWDDGSEHTWGHVLAFEPPTRFRITWEIHAEVTEVDVQFKALGPGLTRVELVHSGWERLTREQIAAATSTPADYSAGWQRILALFAEVAAA
jgi:uncharacterized protein YndB with AHSA1/START domain